MLVLKAISILLIIIVEFHISICLDTDCPLSIPNFNECLRSNAYSNLVRTQTDESGLITTAVFERNTSKLNFWPQQHWEEFQIRVPDDYIVVGGGIKGSNAIGNLITASYPNNDLSAWVISSKDHSHPEPIHAQGYAIGLKIKGMSKVELLNYIFFCSGISNCGAPIDETQANSTLPENYVLIGGGIEVNWRYFGKSGNLAYASFPIKRGWQVSSKSHQYSSKAVTHSFVIGIKNILKINGVKGYMRNDISSQISNTAAHPASFVMAKNGFALTTCGAKVDNLGLGNFLWKIQPVKSGEEKTFNGCEASSKDHAISSPSSLTTYAVSLKFVPATK